MAKVTFNENLCKGCGLCVTACPKKIVVLKEILNAKGYHPAGVEKTDECIGCAFCATGKLGLSRNLKSFVLQLQ